MMKFENLYSEAISFWPSNIDITDAILVESDNAFISNSISTAWMDAEAKCSSEAQELMVWVMYKILHEKALALFKSAQFNVDVMQSLDLKEVKVRFEKTLQEPGNEELASEYQG